MTQYRIHGAMPPDAQPIVDLHYRAVQALIGRDYPQTVLEAWSPLPDAQRIAWIVSVIAGDESEVLVAEDEELLGFCMFRPGAGLIGALYVAPEHAGRGIGAALLRRAEAQCAAAGATHIQLKSSLNAVQLYSAQGYVHRGDSMQALADRSSMACVEMDKALGARDANAPLPQFD